MPVLSRFYGIIIRMYFLGSEHNPPHIHAIYGEYIGAVDIQTGELMEGDLPRRALKMVQEWTQEHKDDLLQIWNTQNFMELPPLE